MSKIFDWLYLGSKREASSELWLTQNRITDVINVAIELKGIVYPASVEVLHIPLYDAHDEDLTPYLSLVNILLKQCAATDRRVLIHCAAGISRSASFVVYHLMVENNMSVGVALSILRKYRPQVRPNSGFLAQLKNCETYSYTPKYSNGKYNIGDNVSTYR